MKVGEQHADWLDAATAEGGVSLRQVLRGLPLERLRRYPAQKRGPLPLGHECRVVRRFVRGGCNQLDASGLAFAYRALASSRERLLNDAFVSGQALSRAQWAGILGDGTVDEWARDGMLVAVNESLWRCAFRVIGTDGLTILGDAPRIRRDPVHLGEDSLLMLDFLRKQPSTRPEHILEVGTGTGILLLAAGPPNSRRHGVDMNRRAARLTQFNAQLNGVACDVACVDIFGSAWKAERYSWVIWNAPFLFLPEDERDANTESDGGHLGIECTLRFVNLLPDLLDDGGRASIMSAAPILISGENCLERGLSAIAESRKLDITVQVIQTFWSSPDASALHRRHDIARFESVFLDIRRGSGELVRQPASRMTMVTDRVRRVALACSTR